MTRCDALIIGGGLVGCASAFHLAGSGASVILLDRESLNGKASGQNAGSLHFQLEHRLIEQSDSLAEHVAAAIPLNRAAIAEWAGLEQTLGCDLEVVMQGGLMVAEDESDLALLEKKFRLEEKWGLDTRLIDGDEARRLAPALSGKVIGAAYCAEEGHANPRLVTAAFAEAARRQGANLRTHCRVAAMRADADGFALSVVDPQGRSETLTARRVLNAAGAWAGEVAALSGLHLPVFPLGLTMNVTERTGPLLGHLIQHSGRRLSMKQVRDGNLLIGGGWPSLLQPPRDGSGGFDLTRRARLNSEAVRRNLATACDILPALRRLHLLRSWTGIVAATPDELPLLGEMRSMPGYFVATGGAGFTLGPTYGRLMSELMLTGRTSLSIAPYSPGRYNHLNQTVD